MDVSAKLADRASPVGAIARVGPIVLWSLVLGLSLYYIVGNAILLNIIPFFSGAEPFASRHGAHGVWLMLHIVGGMTALLIGSVQFSASVRRHYLTVHRWSGRVYLVSVAVSVASAIRILLLPHSSFGFRIGIGGLALAWILTTGLAYTAVLSRQIALHQEWMIRSYVVTFGFVFFRLLLNPLASLGIATRPEIISAVSWLCWALPLLVTEVVFAARKIVQAGAAQRRALAKSSPVAVGTRRQPF
jgi:hypothetical protein